MIRKMLRFVLVLCVVSCETEKALSREKNTHICEVKESSQILFKHLGAVHTHTTLTITQRKLSNILLKNALTSISVDKEHKIPMRELLAALDWANLTKAPETLRESLRDLARIQIQWNILGRDNKNKWTTSALLAHVSIKDGYIFYSYSLALRELFKNPNIYARLNLDVQRKFKNKHAVILWELICGDLSSKKEERISTEWIPYEKVLELVDLFTNNYLKRYTSFRDRVLEPAVQEINENSDITVCYEEKRVSRKITHIRFFGEKKAKEKRDLCIDSPYIRLLLTWGFSEEKARKILSAHPEEDIARALTFMEYFSKTSKESIQNPVAFFNKALRDGWSKPVEKEMSDVKPEIVIDSADGMASIRESLRLALGDAEYVSWFGQARFRMEGEVLVVVCSSEFVRDTVDVQYKFRLSQISGGPVRVVSECVRNK